MGSAARIPCATKSYCTLSPSSRRNRQEEIRPEKSEANAFKTSPITLLQQQTRQTHFQSDPPSHALFTFLNLVEYLRWPATPYIVLISSLSQVLTSSITASLCLIIWSAATFR